MEGNDEEGKVEKKRGAERREGRRHLSVIERSTVGTLSTVYLTHNLEYYVQCWINYFREKNFNKLDFLI